MKKIYATFAAAGLMFFATAAARADSAANYWSSPGFVTLNVGQGTYSVPAIAQRAPQELPEGPGAIQAGYREGPSIPVSARSTTPAVTNPADSQFSVGNARIVLPALQ